MEEESQYTSIAGQKSSISVSDRRESVAAPVVPIIEESKERGSSPEEVRKETERSHAESFHKSRIEAYPDEPQISVAESAA